MKAELFWTSMLVAIYSKILHHDFTDSLGEL